MAGIDEYMFAAAHDPEIINPEFESSVRNVPARRLLPPQYLPVKPFQLEPTEEEKANTDFEETVRSYVEISVGLATLITENLLSHPLVVLRRQCQVQPDSKRWHLEPFTLIPVVVRLHQSQGVTTLWKGLGSSLLIRGMTLAVEDSLSKFTPWPKDLGAVNTMKSFGQHMLLKCVALTIITPFYSASLVETVQSDIASEKPGLFDVFKEGLCRVVSWGSPAKGRMLPVWALVGPTVLNGLFKYLISQGVRKVAIFVLHNRFREEQTKRGALYKDVEERNGNLEVAASFIGLITAEVVTYPMETILHRLHLQGTRTIIDNLDTGSEVVPILTGYEGALDCYSQIVAGEGTTGLFKGFGALIAQFAVHWAVLKLTRVVVAKVASAFRPPVSRGPPPATPNSTFEQAYKARTPLN